jgi:hypothetical protein
MGSGICGQLRRHGWGKPGASAQSERHAIG